MSCTPTNKQLDIGLDAQFFNLRSKLLVSLSNTNAGLYIWCSRGESDWDSVAWLAELGILATPGHFYGPAGDHHIRVALTATDADIEAAAARINSAVRS